MTKVLEAEAVTKEAEAMVVEVEAIEVEAVASTKAVEEATIKVAEAADLAGAAGISSSLTFYSIHFLFPLIIDLLLVSSVIFEQPI